ncbi:MAG: type II toxin-antitoxin system PemK/MazF family toxin [Acidimicrobiia bacterium]|nr:type II toxin-antitoxin system PemK/MazF family toxin [Acidimicrobiia bacterium]
MDPQPLVSHHQLWWADTLAGDRPVLVLTRDPVAAVIGKVVVVTLTRTDRRISTHLAVGPDDGLPVDSFVNFDDLHTIPRPALRVFIGRLSAERSALACRMLTASCGCD